MEVKKYMKNETEKRLLNFFVMILNDEDVENLKFTREVNRFGYFNYLITFERKYNEFSFSFRHSAIYGHYMLYCNAQYYIPKIDSWRKINTAYRFKENEEDEWILEGKI